jgi:hypothetical protein
MTFITSIGLDWEEQSLLGQGILKGDTIDLLFDWSGFVCFANKNKNGQFSYNRFQTSQTGGHLYSDTSLFSIPCLGY